VHLRFGLGPAVAASKCEEEERRKKKAAEEAKHTTLRG
jgi:hypothetical protein